MVTNVQRKSLEETAQENMNTIIMRNWQGKEK